MSEKEYAHWLLGQARRRQLDNSERQWLSDYGHWVSLATPGVPASFYERRSTGPCWLVAFFSALVGAVLTLAIL